MSVLLPNDHDWLVANWVSFGFFSDCLPFLKNFPCLKDDIQFCVDAELDTLDLRGASGDTIRNLASLTDTVIAEQREVSTDTADDPDASDVYMRKLQGLKSVLADVLGIGPST